MKFLAIDFETASYKRDSACAIGLVRVEEGIVVERQTHLIKPPSPWFVFTYLHGIAWKDVKNEPTFGELWPRIDTLFKGVDFLAAHNSSFDEGVLRACCSLYELPYPEVPFRCTVQISRQLWNIRPTKLDNVCEYFGIPLNHHEAGSDTEACAQIMIRALEHMQKNNDFKPLKKRF